MKPQPMSDGQIANEWGMALMRHDTTREQLFDFARAIIAARDAQWAAMIGEPVAWGHEAFVGGSWVLQWPVRCSQSSAKEDCAMYGKAETLRVSPLYAIKETP